MYTYDFDQLSLFDNLTPVQSAFVRHLFVPIETCSGDTLFKQGDPALFLYIVIDGEVLIQYKPDDAPVITVARIKKEGVLGWSAALGSPYYTSAAVCSTDCILLRVSGQDLRDLCDQYPDTGSLILNRLAEVIAKRLRNTHAHVMALLEQGLRLGSRKLVEAGRESPGL